MNTFTAFLFGIMFAATAGAAFAFMWKSMSMVQQEYNKPPRPRHNIHPEMADVKSGEELLVFNTEEDDDGDGEIMIVRK